ncbi:MAG: response regulator [Magnetococcales bacterium]|nr:response regulator [Magnetococcales bacterium]
MPDTEPKPRVLIVDDIPGNIKLLGTILSGAFKTVVATSGQEALDIAFSGSIDIILLDILMPGMDGYEVLETLKAHPETDQIPVIFITSKGEPRDEVKGLQLGCVDFISKPISPDVVLARVRTHLELKQQRQRLQTFAHQLERRVQEEVHKCHAAQEEKLALQEQALRTAQLATLGEVSANISHEINNPNMAIQLNAEMLKAACRDMAIVVREQASSQEDIDIGGLPLPQAIEHFPALADEIVQNSLRIKTIIENLKKMVRPNASEQGDAVDLQELIDSAVLILRNQIRKHTDHFQVIKATNLPTLWGNAQQLGQVFLNIVMNALQSLPDRNHGVTVEVLPVEDNTEILVVVRDQGVGIPSQNIDQLTTPFFSTKLDEGGTGLGLSISSTILENHGGSLLFDSTVGKGTSVTVRLPINPAMKEQQP